MIVEISSIREIKENVYGKSLLIRCYPIIDSPFGFGGCVDHTRVVYALYPKNDKNYEYLNHAQNDPDEYFELRENAFEKKYLDSISDYCYIHNSFFEQKTSIKTPGNAVDLGLSVLWADMNIGASSPSDYGKLYGYGDVSGEKVTEDDSAYIDTDIVNTKHDIAKAAWGDKWRMPISEELEELCAKCKWRRTMKNGIFGSEVIGPNGNSIFLPFAGTRIGVDTFRRGQWGVLWSGTRSHVGNSGVEMTFYGLNGSLNWGAAFSNGNSVRAVKDFQ